MLRSKAYLLVHDKNFVESRDGIQMFQVSGFCNMIPLQILIVHVGISVFNYRKKYSNKWERGCIVSSERYLA